MQKTQETWIQSLGLEDPLQYPTPIFFPVKFHGQKNLAGYNPWGIKESNTVKYLSKYLHTSDADTKLNSLAQFSHSSSPTLCDPIGCNTPSHPVYHNTLSFLELMSIELVMPSNHLILGHPLLLLLSIFPSIRVFFNESALCIKCPKYWSFRFNISPSSEHPGLICFKMDWLDLLEVQRTLKSLIQYHSSKASILRCSALFIAQFSYRYMTTAKTIALTRQIFVGKVMSLLLNMLSRLVITFLSRSKHPFISRLQSPSAVILEPPKIVCHCFPIYFP